MSKWASICLIISCAKILLRGQWLFNSITLILYSNIHQHMLSFGWKHPYFVYSNTTLKLHLLIHFSLFIDVLKYNAILSFYLCMVSMCFQRIPSEALLWQRFTFLVRKNVLQYTDESNEESKPFKWNKGTRCKKTLTHRARQKSNQ